MDRHPYDDTKDKSALVENEEEPSIFDEEMDDADNVDEFLSYLLEE